MKKLLIITTALSVLISLAAQPGQLRTNGVIEWDYPTNQLSTNMVFKVYSHTNVAISVSSWPILSTVWWTNSFGITNKNGTNYAVYRFVFPVAQSQQYFSITASNWHGESDFSGVASTPALPRSDTLIRLGL